MPNLVKLSLEKGKIEEKEWEDNKKINKLINDCINIEKTIKNINDIYDKIKIFNLNKELEIEFYPKIDEIEKGLIKEIQNFGKIKEVKAKNNNLLNNIDNAKDEIQIDHNLDFNEKELLNN